MTTSAPPVLRGLTDAYARRPVSSVAVVANAPLPPSSARAAAVDACDLVVRVNGFALDGPDRPPAVGSRCDVVVFSRGVRATPWLFRDYRERLYLLVEPGRLHWEPELLPDWWPPDLGQVPVPNREVTIPLSRRLGFDPLHEVRWGTTGTTAAWLARTLYPDAELHLAGFSCLDEPEQTSWAHAYGESCAISAEHVLAREGELLRGWLATGRVSVHR